jgi:peptide deformylase
VLRHTAQPVEHVTDDVRKMLTDMADTLATTETGVGIAANQVGLLKRLVVLDIGRINGGKEHEFLHLINPTILWISDDTSPYLEGCLSLPDQYADVLRPARVRVKYVDPKGQVQELETGETLYSHVLQHEIDHLNGKLFIDYISSIKRNIILRKLKKMSRDMGDGDKSHVL